MQISHICGAILLVSAIAPSIASATEPFPDNKPYLSLQGGPLIVAGTWDLADSDINRAVLPDTGLMFDYGAQLGWQLTPRGAIELGATMSPVRTTADTRSNVLSYELDALFHLNDNDITPYLLGGVGAYHAISGDLATDVDPAGHIGIGVRAMLWKNAALRGEVRYVGTDLYDSNMGNIGIRIGVDLFLPDRTPPDADEDGIIDEMDVCPTVPGVESADGCPDADGDGITDADDRCPEAAGSAERQGCPDTDGDGIVDKDDRCPEAAGPEAQGGCPDTDEDGLIDAEDVCPNEPGPRGTSGCPDTDRDGIADKDDKCPEIRGLKSHDGCVPDEVQQFTGAIEGIYFQSGKAAIQSRSYSVLDSTIEILTRFPDLRLRIEGHTDSQGNDEYNLTLSKERAAAVVSYMVEKGIAADRLQSEGYGETKPVADNGTSSGRAKNRRIEFSIVEQ